ncbi:MAG: SRPBCC family protein [Acidimicrobiales bacterium]
MQFTVSVDFDAPPRSVWEELVDWEAHGAWIPLTRTEVDGDDPTAVGATFTAWTGVRRLALEDRMRVAECTWNAERESGTCKVDKLGPVLQGSAGFIVAPLAEGTRVEWHEDVSVRYLPRFVAPLAAVLGSIGFRQGMKRLDTLLARRGV